MNERVNTQLKDDFGASQIRVRGAAKVMPHLMFGLLVLTVDQCLRIASPLASEERYERDFRKKTNPWEARLTEARHFLARRRCSCL